MGHALRVSEQLLDSRFLSTESGFADLIHSFQNRIDTIFPPEGNSRPERQSPEIQQNLSRKGPYVVASLPTFHRKSRRTDIEEARRAIEQIKIGQEAKDTRKRLADESDWIALNRNEFAGKWVALLGNKLLASSDLASEVFEAVAGTRPTPLVIRIEAEHSPFAGW